MAARENLIVPQKKMLRRGALIGEDLFDKLHDGGKVDRSAVRDRSEHARSTQRNGRRRCGGRFRENWRECGGVKPAESVCRASFGEESWSRPPLSVVSTDPLDFSDHHLR